MSKKDFSKRILVGVTGYRENHWRSKLKEIDKFKITKVSLFLEQFRETQRKKIYQILLNSKIKEIPLVHIRNDMKKEELIFLSKNFGSSYFTIHESSFKFLEEWKGFYKNLYLEMNKDNFVSSYIKVGRLGGFCIDLVHFKIEATKWSKEFDYILKRRKTEHYFDCNHLNGYSPKENKDLHTIRNLKDFNYLKTLPAFVFGDVIALETYNSITEQLKFKKYLSKLLNNLF
ncbi:MAG: hypothetical protein NTU58_00655 [Candidatus Nealsonbacteria bacterium]|nr:hypothetical protein [Candidatus Nealsonbacteria bacterium]